MIGNWRPDLWGEDDKDRSEGSDPDQEDDQEVLCPSPIPRHIHQANRQSNNCTEQHEHAHPHVSVEILECELISNWRQCGKCQDRKEERPDGTYLYCRSHACSLDCGGHGELLKSANQRIGPAVGVLSLSIEPLG